MDSQKQKIIDRTTEKPTSYKSSLETVERKRATAPHDRDAVENKVPELLSVVIPVFNEQDCLKELIDRCLNACEKMNHPFELILIDDGSSDNSPQMIDDAANASDGKVIAVHLNRNYGQHAAIICGFEESRGTIVVTLDADLQNPPEEIPNLIAAIDEGYDVVGTVRKHRRDSFFRKKASAIVNKVAQKATGVMMNDYGCMLRAYRRHVINAVLQCHERSTFIPVLANSFAKTTTEIEVMHDSRTHGDSKYSVWKLISLQFDLLTSMTTFPLRLMSYLGFLVSLTGIGFGVLLFAMRFIYGAEWAAEGVFTLFSILFIFIGAQFVAMGLLGEYIGRIYHDVRGRPRYFVEKVTGRDVPQTEEQENSNQKGSEV